MKRISIHFKQQFQKQKLRKQKKLKKKRKLKKKKLHKPQKIVPLAEDQVLVVQAVLVHLVA